MNQPDVSYEPVWEDDDADEMTYLYTMDRVDFYLDLDGDPRARFGPSWYDWTYIGERIEDSSSHNDWTRAPQSARDHLTALAALHR